MPKVVLLIFVSGKVVLTGEGPRPCTTADNAPKQHLEEKCAGAKSRADMYQAFELIYPVLQGFKKGAPAAASLPAPASAPQHQVTACTFPCCCPACSRPDSPVWHSSPSPCTDAASAHHKPHFVGDARYCVQMLQAGPSSLGQQLTLTLGEANLSR